MQLVVMGRSPKGGLDLLVSLFILLHALRLECVKSMLWTVSSHRERLLLSSLEIRELAARCDALLGNLKESFTFFIPAWYIKLSLATRDTLFCSIDDRTAKILVYCVRITCIWKWKLLAKIVGNSAIAFPISLAKVPALHRFVCTCYAVRCCCKGGSML